uniref:Cytochrome P450 71C2 n=1 Tax=Aegilops tauschii TaxID=37682 RepID=R7W8G5_AEGTA
MEFGQGASRGESLSVARAFHRTPHVHRRSRHARDSSAGMVYVPLPALPLVCELLLVHYDRRFYAPMIMSLASRPRSMVSEILMYGSSDIAFAPYNEDWRQARKLVTTHMLSVKKVQSFRNDVAEEDAE